MSNFNEERLGKIVEIAKRGYGGEKENAIKIVKALCKKHGLNFDLLMQGGEKIQEYAIPYKKKTYENLVSQIISVYGFIDENTEIFQNKIRKMFFINTTQEKYFETLNAVDVLTRLYEKEKAKIKDAVFYGFLEKHDLWNPYPKQRKKEKKMTAAEAKAREAGSSLARHMEDAEILKRLKS
jgi:hypothetical protein